MLIASLQSLHWGKDSEYKCENNQHETIRWQYNLVPLCTQI
jgi:hypothetical protein